MRIALVIMPTWSLKTAPLGLATISAVLKEAGHAVEIFDFNLKLWQEIQSFSLGHDPWTTSSSKIWQNFSTFEEHLLPKIHSWLQKKMQEVLAGSPDVVGFSIYDSSFPCTEYSAGMVKQQNPKVKIVYGGPAANKLNFDQGREACQLHFDAAVMGEGEATILELLERWKNDQSLVGCLGIAHFDKERNLIIEAPRNNIDISNLPFPSFDGFEIFSYREKTLPVMMSRGCVAKCTFCSETRFWKNFRIREAERTFLEFKNHKEKYGINSFYMADSLVNGNFKILDEFLDLLIQSDERFLWSGYARIDKRMTLPFLEKMSMAGYRMVSYGLETGSQKVMDLMEKRTTVEVAREVVRNTHRAGIRVQLNILVGFPGETEEEFQKTLEFIHEQSDSIDDISFGDTLAIVPNTPLYLNPAKYGVRVDAAGKALADENGNWISDDLDGPNTDTIRRNRLKRLAEFLQQFDHISWTPGGEWRRRVYSASPESNRKQLGEKRVWPKPKTAPGFLHWSFGNDIYASAAQAKSSDFRIWFDREEMKIGRSFREEVYAACAEIDRKRKGKKVALCVSGGIQSELLAIALRDSQIPYEMYFLDIWGLNRKHFDQWSSVLEAISGKKVQIVELKRDYFLALHSRKVFQQYATEFPTYLAMTYLFENISKEEFIVAGEGDLNISNELGKVLLERNSDRFFSEGWNLPVSSSAVFYYLWAEQNQREGEFAFFSSTGSLLASLVGHKKFQRTEYSADGRGVIYTEFPEISKRAKTTNWDSPLAKRENIFIRSWIDNYCARHRVGDDFWQPSAGSLIPVESTFPFFTNRAPNLGSPSAGSANASAAFP